MEKPLFIPLKTEWFRAFEAGEKSVEYRLEGTRWNADTCRIGRAVTLSHGYSGSRLQGVVAGFEIVGPDAHPAIAQIYPGHERIAAISIRLSP